MENFTDFLNNFSLEQYMPTLDKMMGWFQWLICLAVRIGPLCILVLGLIHLLISPNEANHKAGFRTYFGMGSITAWNFTQRISGILMTLTGAVLTIFAFSAASKFASQDLMTATEKAFDLIKVQVICALVIHVFMFVLAAAMFDRKGKFRFPLQTDGPIGTLLFSPNPIRALTKKPEKNAKKPAPQPAAEQAAPEVSPAEFEQQGQQVITADDIVIEDLE